MKDLLFCVMFLGLSLNAASQTKIELEKTGDLYLVPCFVNGLRMKFLFDSGASDVTLSLTEAIYMIKNGFLSKQDIKESEYYQIANGQLQEGTIVNLQKIVIGGIAIKNVRATIIHTMNAPLLLGQSALSKLGNFSFDYSNNMLVLGGLKQNNAIANNCKSGNCIDGYGSDEDILGIYVGTFKNGQRHGFGTWISTLDFVKVTYVGNFMNHEMEGQGTMTWATGDKYIGNFKNGSKNGFGKFIWENGDTYEGNWKDNKESGQGTMTYAVNNDFNLIGDKYVGNWKDGKKSGKGTETSSDTKYEGEWENNLWHGYGTLTFLGGYGSYVGGFKNGRYHGYGTQTYSDGSQQTGYWNEGKFIK